MMPAAFRIAPVNTGFAGPIGDARHGYRHKIVAIGRGLSEGRTPGPFCRRGNKLRKPASKARRSTPA
jgi:hypothetical protein